MRRVSVNGVELEYEVTGSGEAVLLISPVLADGFVPLVREPALADRYRLIRYHKRGWVGSTHSEGPVTVEQHAADAAALLDHLGIERVGVVGQSGGTPYALGASARLGDRVRAVALCGGIVPLGERDALTDVGGPMLPMFKLARRAPWLLKPLLRMASRNPDKAAERALKDLPDRDRAVLEDPAMLDIHRRATREILSSPAAMAQEMRLIVQPSWGFDLADVRAPVAYWVGDRDMTHPPSMARKLAQRIPGDVHVVPDAATFGLRGSYPAVLRFVT
jgi:pimeloyl-ACP methyl ester carboxylesterase